MNSDDSYELWWNEEGPVQIKKAQKKDDQKDSKKLELDKKRPGLIKGMGDANSDDSYELWWDEEGPVRIKKALKKDD